MPPPEVRLQAFVPGDHAALLRRWLQAPHVAQWWGDPEEVFRNALVWPTEACAVIEADGAAVGYTCWRTPGEDELKAAGLEDLSLGLVDIDMFIGELEFLGRGVGSKALALLLARLRTDPSVAVAGVGTAIANDRAVRAFSKAGFRTLREFEDPVFGQCVYMVADVSEAA